MTQVFLNTSAAALVAITADDRPLVVVGGTLNKPNAADYPAVMADMQRQSESGVERLRELGVNVSNVLVVVLANNDASLQACRAEQVRLNEIVMDSVSEDRLVQIHKLEEERFQLIADHVDDTYETVVVGFDEPDTAAFFRALDACDVEHVARVKAGYGSDRDSGLPICPGMAMVAALWGAEYCVSRETVDGQAPATAETHGSGNR